MFDISKEFSYNELQLLRCYPEQGLNIASLEFQKGLREYHTLINKGILYNHYPDKFNQRDYTVCKMTYTGSLLQAFVIEQVEWQSKLARCQRESYQKGYEEAIEKMGYAMAEMIASHIGEPSCK